MEIHFNVNYNDNCTNFAHCEVQLLHLYKKRMTRVHLHYLQKCQLVVMETLHKLRYHQTAIRNNQIVEYLSQTYQVDLLLLLWIKLCLKNLYNFVIHKNIMVFYEPLYIFHFQVIQFIFVVVLKEAIHRQKSLLYHVVDVYHHDINVLVAH